MPVSPRSIASVGGAPVTASTAAAHATRRRRAGLLVALLLLAGAAPLAGCGKKAEPGPPPGEVSTYPRIYPHD